MGHCERAANTLLRLGRVPSAHEHSPKGEGLRGRRYERVSPAPSGPELEGAAVSGLEGGQGAVETKKIRILLEDGSVCWPNEMESSQGNFDQKFDLRPDTRIGIINETNNRYSLIIYRGEIESWTNFKKGLRFRQAQTLFQNM